jgi:hypothetical protein
MNSRVEVSEVLPPEFRVEAEERAAALVTRRVPAEILVAPE